MENPQTYGLFFVPPSITAAMRISPVNLKILAYTLDVEGFDSRSVLQECGIASFDDIQEEGEWVPAELFDRMMAATARFTGDPSFGIVAGKSLALMKYGAITPLALFSRDLRQLIADIARFAPLVVPQSEIDLEEAKGAARLIVTPVIDGGLSGHFRAEQIVTSSVQMLRFAGAETEDILQVDFSYAEPHAQRQRYVANFGANIRFNCRVCAIDFNPALLDRPLPGYDPMAYTAALTRVQSLLSARKAGTDMAEQVRQWLLRRFPHLPSVAESAEHLNMNERSFRRQLGMLGTSHADLTQECQRLVAERLLAENKLPLKQIAEQIGFSSVHSFHRAFRRWSGTTPSEWRDAGGRGS